jgi:DNA polymerase-4
MIACLTVSYFATAVERRDDAALARTPLVLGGQPWEPRPLFAYSREVAQRGVKPGMSLRLAHVLSPQAHFMPAAQPRYLDASGEIADLLTDFTPLVEPEELWIPAAPQKQQATAAGRSLPARYAVDLEGLPPAEAVPLAQEIGRAVRHHMQLAAAVGLAANKFTAQVAAAVARPNHVRPVLPEEATEFLAGRSVHFLPLEPETARRLRLLGIHTLGQLATLPAGSVQTQFGPDLLPFYRLVRGQADADPRLGVRPEAAERREQAGHVFEEPVTDRLVLENVLAHLAAGLAGRLADAGLEGRTLHLTWETARQGSQRQTHTLRRPTADAKRLAAALHELLVLAPFPAAPDEAEAWGGVSGLELAISGLTPVFNRQMSLFESAAAGLAGQVLKDVAARYGATCLHRPVLVDAAHPLPERRFQFLEWQAAGAG